jgi:hypothetical protein
MKILLTSHFAYRQPLYINTTKTVGELPSITQQFPSNSEYRKTTPTFGKPGLNMAFVYDELLLFKLTYLRRRCGLWKQ